MEMPKIDLDLFNQEQRPNNYDNDCLEFWQYLMESWKIDTSDEDYERMRDERFLHECKYEQW